MNPLLQAALGAIFRWAFTFVAGLLVTAKIWEQEEAGRYVAAASLAAVALLWSLWQKYKDRLKIVTALSMSKPMSEAQLEKVVAAGNELPSVATPKLEVPVVGPTI